MSKLLQPPCFEEVVETFDLTILKRPADLALEAGDLVLTKSGDIQFDTVAYSAMWRFVQNWRWNAPALAMLFESVFAAVPRIEAEQKRADALQQSSLDHWFKTGAFPSGRIQDSHVVSDLVGALAFGRDCFAGSFVIVVAALLQQLKDDIDSPSEDWRRTEPLIEGQSFGAVVVAGANSFRHYDEWIKTNPPNSQQQRSRRVLEAALGGIIESGKLGFPREICHRVLDRLSDGGDPALFNTRLFAFAHSLAVKRDFSPTLKAGQ